MLAARTTLRGAQSILNLVRGTPLISSPDIDKVLRRRLSPILREHGFTKVSARKSWGWHTHSVWVLQIRAVGNYFSQVTGWPPMSVCVWTGVYYDFIPFTGHTPPKIDSKGRLIPDELYCHMRSHLSCTLDQRVYTKELTLPAERSRNDIWWFETDGSNMTAAVENIAQCFVGEGEQWFPRHTDLPATFASIERERDCYVKYYRAKYFARHLGLDEQYRLYADLAEKEGARIAANRF
jgi:hypothetical protein